MPIYEYQCEACHTSFEALVMRSEPAVQCPACGSDQLAREMSVFASGAEAGGGPASTGAAPRACCGGGCGCR
jgi:putative FmdB family regulatory protein